mmetsp:Transcript_53957/g.89012  ORF Transcript_53957/g.89012 Transcript_53957/m.89012 type:complete len:227 (-) Transcript_53957:121-801(-)
MQVRSTASGTGIKSADGMGATKTTSDDTENMESMKSRKSKREDVGGGPPTAEGTTHRSVGRRQRNERRAGASGTGRKRSGSRRRKSNRGSGASGRRSGVRKSGVRKSGSGVRRSKSDGKSAGRKRRSGVRKRRSDASGKGRVGTTESALSPGRCWTRGRCCTVKRRSLARVPYGPAWDVGTWAHALRRMGRGTATRTARTGSSQCPAPASRCSVRYGAAARPVRTP